MISKEEMMTFAEKVGRFPDVEEMFKEPIGWFPTKPSNPSKLRAHKFVDGEWQPLAYVKFVPWPEKFPL